MLLGKGISPLTQRRLGETVDLAVGLGVEGPGRDVLNAQQA